MNINYIDNIDNEALAPYVSLTEAQLRNRLDPSQAIFIAESPKVIKVALSAGYRPVSMLCEERHITGDAAEIIAACPDMPVYTSSREQLQNLTGYTLTRGVLCAMHRPADTDPAAIVKSARRVAVIDGVVDTTNIGAIFRSAAALGIDAVLLTRSSCDPFNRRSVRVSMGSVFLIPWGWIDDAVTSLHELGFKTVAMALRDDSVDISSPILKEIPRLAIILGTEGEGLSQQVIDRSDYVCRIPMAHAVDSLNVAAASAVAFWEIVKTSC